MARIQQPTRQVLASEVNEGDYLVCKGQKYLVLCVYASFDGSEVELTCAASDGDMAPTFRHNALVEVA